MKNSDWMSYKVWYLKQGTFQIFIPSKFQPFQSFLSLINYPICDSLTTNCLLINFFLVVMTLNDAYLEQEVFEVPTSFCVKGTSVLFQFSRCKASPQWLHANCLGSDISIDIHILFCVLYFLVRFVFIQNSRTTTALPFHTDQLLIVPPSLSAIVKICRNSEKATQDKIQNEIYT